MKTILEELTQRGHEVTVLRPSGSIFLGDDKSSAIKFENYASSFSREYIENFYTQSLGIIIYETVKNPFWKYSRFQKIMGQLSD